MPKRTLFYCQDGKEAHVIGEIIWTESPNQTERVSALYVYEHSLSSDEEVPDKLPQKRFVANGKATGIECTICRRERDWNLSNRATVSLMIDLLNALYEPAKRRDAVMRNHV